MSILFQDPVYIIQNKFQIHVCIIFQKQRTLLIIPRIWMCLHKKEAIIKINLDCNKTFPSTQIIKIKAKLYISHLSFRDSMFSQLDNGEISFSDGPFNIVKADPYRGLRYPFAFTHFRYDD